MKLKEKMAQEMSHYIHFSNSIKDLRESAFIAGFDAAIKLVEATEPDEARRWIEIPRFKLLEIGNEEV